ncbi:MAG: O-antigen ligase family protein, partial [Planctomycetes bacterium]|nr:O-antigen ligase family protein [Planctomycetota bacterium]
MTNRIMDAITTHPSIWRRIETGLLWLLLCAPLVWDPRSMMTSQYKASYINLMACLIVAVFLFRPFFRKGFSFSPAKVDFVLALFFLLAGLSLIWSVNASAHLKRFFLLASSAVGFYLIRIRMAEGDDPRRILNVIISIATLVALLDGTNLLIEAFNTNPQAGAEEAGFKVGSFLFIHNNVASLYIVAVVPLAITGLLMAQRIGVKLLYLISTLSLIGYLVLLQSRAAWVEVILAVVVLSLGWLFSKRWRPVFGFMSMLLNKRWVLALLVLLMIGAFLLPLSYNFSSHAKSCFMKTIKLLELDYRRHFFRLDIWRKTFNMVSDYPVLGVGLGNFPVIFPAYHKLEKPKSHPHNEYF